MRFPKSISLIGLLSIAIIGGTYLGLRYSDAQQVRDLVAAQGLLAPVVFLLLKVSSNVFVPLGGTAYFLSAEPLFGLRWGFVWLFLGDLTGYSLCFLISRYYAPDAKRLMNAPLRKWKFKPKPHADLVALIYGRTFMFGLQDLVSYAAGLTSISFGLYFAVTAAATFAHTAVGMTIGRALTGSHPVFLLLYSVLTIFVIPSLWVFVQRRRAGGATRPDGQ